MAENTGDIETTSLLIKSLSSNDPVVRQKARERLIEVGDREVTRALVGEMVNPNSQVRWEAAKALTGIADPVSAHSLMYALDDEDEDVRWVAGEGLIALGKVGLLTVLSGLAKRGQSLDFCKSSHHVLHDLNQDEFGEIVAPVLKALKSSEPEVAASVAAYHALGLLRNDNS